MPFPHLPLLPPGDIIIRVDLSNEQGLHVIKPAYSSPHSLHSRPDHLCYPALLLRWISRCVPGPGSRNPASFDYNADSFAYLYTNHVTNLFPYFHPLPAPAQPHPYGDPNADIDPYSERHPHPHAYTHRNLNTHSHGDIRDAYPNRDAASHRYTAAHRGNTANPCCFS
jgi:hypothetical protein